MERTHRFLALAAAAALPTCTPTQIAYFLVIIDPNSTRAPDSCFEAKSVPAPANQDQVRAELFCQVGTAPDPETGATSTVMVRQMWAMFEGTDGRWYLELAESTADFGDESSAALEGQFKNGKFSFTRTNNAWDKSDEQRQMTVDNTLTIEFEVGGANLKGSINTSRTVACTGSRCASDFGARCPACSFSYPVTGRRVDGVEEEHAVGR